jgi:hypothetical protein
VGGPSEKWAKTADSRFGGKDEMGERLSRYLFRCWYGAVSLAACNRRDVDDCSQSDTSEESLLVRPHRPHHVNRRMTVRSNFFSTSFLMSDHHHQQQQQATESKPKPGSLRDRIAAFESKSSSSSPSQPASTPSQAIRAKPAHLQWKPRPPSPSSLAPAENPAGVSAGLSASDAKQSISKAGSLKERMAALQGKGAFGQPAGATTSTPPPKPTGDKPKWRPPVNVAPLSPGAAAGTTAGEGQPAFAPRSPPLPSVFPARRPSGDQQQTRPCTPPPAATEPESSTSAQGKDEGDEANPDPQEEERQRRAAIAARMARLGGAKLGMTPPAFGTKPSFTRKTDVPVAEVSIDKAEADAKAAPVSESDSIGQSVDLVRFCGDERRIISDYPATAAVVIPSEVAATGLHILHVIFPESLKQVCLADSRDQRTSPPQARSSPSMPVPIVPRRAAPPRRKTPTSTDKSTTTTCLGDDVRENPENIRPSEGSGVAIEGHNLEGGDRPKEVGEILKEVIEDTGAQQVEETQGEDELSPTQREHATEVSKAVAELSSDSNEEGLAASVTSAVLISSPEPDDLQEQHKGEATLSRDFGFEEAGGELAPTCDAVNQAADTMTEQGPASSVAQEPASAETGPEPAQEDEEDQAIRRKRISERLARDGSASTLGASTRSILPASADKSSQPVSPNRADAAVSSPDSKTLTTTSYDAMPASPRQDMSLPGIFEQSIHSADAHSPIVGRRASSTVEGSFPSDVHARALLPDATSSEEPQDGEFRL